jgi:hypothetical protein
VFGKNTRKEFCYDNLHISRNAWDTNLVKVGNADSPPPPSVHPCPPIRARKVAIGRWLTRVTSRTGQPRIPLCKLGVERRRRFRSHPPQRAWKATGPNTLVQRPHGDGPRHRLVCAHTNCTRFGWTESSSQDRRNPFNDRIIASGSDDGKVFIWQVPQGFTLYSDAEEIEDVSPVGKLSGHSRYASCHLVFPGGYLVLVYMLVCVLTTDQKSRPGPVQPRGREHPCLRIRRSLHQAMGH